MLIGFWVFGPQGPPGTGKTRTLLALLEILARIGGAPGRLQRMGPILACADTNAATDNLVEGLVERGINVTRLGQPAKVGAVQYTVYIYRYK